MSRHVSYIVRFKDGTNSNIENRQGLDRDVLFAYAEQHLGGLTHDRWIIEKEEDLIALATIAGEMYPIVVADGDDDAQTYWFESNQAPDVEWDNLWYAYGKHRFWDADLTVKPYRNPVTDLVEYQNRTRYNYARYAQMANQGRCIFGAQLKNIESIVVELSY